MIEHLSKLFPENPMNLWFLLLFVAVFAGIVAYLLRPAKQAELEATSHLPLND
jgi:cbb3-type cytochrome oxidase subunit 3